MGRLSIAKMFILPRPISKFNAIPTRQPDFLKKGSRQNYSKIHMKVWMIKNKMILKKKKKVDKRGLPPTDDIYYVLELC